MYRMPGDTQPDLPDPPRSSYRPGRQNLTGILAGRLSGDSSPRLRLFDLPVVEQMAGPSQVEALIEQDPAISQQFSLWRTGGSRVWTGHLHMIPVGDRLVYMEPVFLAAKGDSGTSPLRRVSDGRRVVMEETLLGAIQALAQEDGGAVGGRPSEPGWCIERRWSGRNGPVCVARRSAGSSGTGRGASEGGGLRRLR